MLYQTILKSYNTLEVDRLKVHCVVAKAHVSHSYLTTMMLDQLE